MFLPTASPADSLVAAAAGTMHSGHSASNPEGLMVFMNVLLLLIVGFGLFMVWGLRGFWWPVVRENTLAKMKCSSPRNCYCIGWCCSCLLPCCVDRFHDPFRLRIVVQCVRDLRRTDALRFHTMYCYVAISCGNNPLKTTAVRKVPLASSAPVVWNDALDLEIQIADEWLYLEVFDCNVEDKATVVGSVQMSISDFYSRMQGSLAEVRSLEGQTRRLLFAKGDGSIPEDAGVITLSLYATRPQTPLPALLPGMGLRSDEELASEPLFSSRF